jgi:hypothetical protein
MKKQIPLVKTIPAGWVVFSSPYGIGKDESELLESAVRSMLNARQFTMDQIVIYLRNKKQRFVCVPKSSLPATFNGGVVDSETKRPLLEALRELKLEDDFKAKADAGQTDREIMEWLLGKLDPETTFIPKTLAKIRKEAGCAPARQGGVRKSHGKTFMRVRGGNWSVMGAMPA